MEMESLINKPLTESEYEVVKDQILDQNLIAMFNYENGIYTITKIF